jgi:hypothetical protein
MTSTFRAGSAFPIIRRLILMAGFACQSSISGFPGGRGRRPLEHGFQKKNPPSSST